MLISVCIDGVLTGGGQLPTTSANLNGLSLYGSHAPDTSWAFLTTSRAPKPAVERWLLQEGFIRWVSLSTMEGAVEEDPVAWKVRALTHMQAANHKVAFHYDADPSSVRAISAIGIPSLLVVAPEHLPRYAETYKPWSELVSDIEHRREVEAEQLRRSRGDG